MAITDFVVAIEIASSKITGIAGKRNADGSINIIAKESESSSDCIKKGAIFNLDKTTQLLSNIISRLEDDLGSSIKKLYVGISGKSLRSIVNTVNREFNEETKVSRALIDNIMQSNKDFPLVDMELLDVVPQEYKIGNDMLAEPVGINAESIEANFVNIIARPSLKENIIKCFRHTGSEIADFLISPVEAANVVLTDTEKRSGCVLVDMGAETTTVSIYKNNILRHIAVIPLGGKNITKDISSLQMEEYEAEELKLKCGSAYTEESEDSNSQDKTYNLNGKYTVEAIKLENIIEARVNEIIQNVNNQITLSKYGDKLMAGAILIGGAANMPNMDVAFRRITKIEQVRIAKDSIIQTGGIGLEADGTNNTLIGLLAAGKENCCRVNPMTGPTIDFPDPVQKPAEKATGKAVEPVQVTVTPAEQPSTPTEAPVETTERTAETVEQPAETTIGTAEPMSSTTEAAEKKSEPVGNPVKETTDETPQQPAEIKTDDMNHTAPEAPQEEPHEPTVDDRTDTTPQPDSTQPSDKGVEEEPIDEDTERKKEIQRRRDCQIHINKAANFIETRRYSEALGEIKLAREYNVEGKIRELDSLENEATRLMKEAEKLNEIREAKRKREEERIRRMKGECERLLSEAEELYKQGDKKEAERKAKEAQGMNIPEFNDRLNSILEKTKSAPKSKSGGWFKKTLFNIMKGADDIMKDNE